MDTTSQAVRVATRLTKPGIATAAATTMTKVTTTKVAATAPAVVAATLAVVVAALLSSRRSAQSPQLSKPGACCAAALASLYLPCTFPVPSLYLPCTFLIGACCAAALASLGCTRTERPRPLWTLHSRVACPSPWCRAVSSLSTSAQEGAACPAPQHSCAISRLRRPAGLVSLPCRSRGATRWASPKLGNHSIYPRSALISSLSLSLLSISPDLLCYLPRWSSCGPMQLPRDSRQRSQTTRQSHSQTSGLTSDPACFRHNERRKVATIERERDAREPRIAFSSVKGKPYNP